MERGECLAVQLTDAELACVVTALQDALEAQEGYWTADGLEIVGPLRARLSALWTARFSDLRAC